MNERNYYELLYERETQLWHQLGKEMKLIQEISKLKALLSDAQAEILRLQTMMETQLKFSERN